MAMDVLIYYIVKSIVFVLQIFTEVLNKEAINIANYPEKDMTDLVTLSNATSSVRYVIDRARSQDHGKLLMVTNS